MPRDDILVYFIVMMLVQLVSIKVSLNRTHSHLAGDDYLRV